MPLVGHDLEKKHKLLRESSFAFLRGTFYRWIQVWAQVCPADADAPAVGSVGDIHIENYGTWRDGEGRLAWGVNDFDEACLLPYTSDLVRLAASALLARGEGHRPKASSSDVCAAILDGYERALQDGARPIVLAEHSGWLGDLGARSLKHPDKFWDKLDESASGDGPSGADAEDLVATLPTGSTEVVTFRRTAGVGSLGRPRFTAVASWNGAKLAREIKAVAPSATAWATGAPLPTSPQAVYATSVRSPDLTYGFSGRWVVRRLAPDCAKVELEEILEAEDRLKMLGAMGRELVNVHAGAPAGLEAIRADWRTRRTHRPDWLEGSAAAMLARLDHDLEEWRQAHP